MPRRVAPPCPNLLPTNPAAWIQVIDKEFKEWKQAQDELGSQSADRGIPIPISQFPLQSKNDRFMSWYRSQEKLAVKSAAAEQRRSGQPPLKLRTSKSDPCLVQQPQPCAKFFTKRVQGTGTTLCWNSSSKNKVDPDCKAYPVLDGRIGRMQVLVSRLNQNPMAVGSASGEDAPGGAKTPSAGSIANQSQRSTRSLKTAAAVGSSAISQSGAKSETSKGRAPSEGQYSLRKTFVPSFGQFSSPERLPQPFGAGRYLLRPANPNHVLPRSGDVGLDPGNIVVP